MNVIAERGDDYQSLASKNDVDVGDLIRANNSGTIRAGASYRLPQTNTSKIAEAKRIREESKRRLSR